MTNFIHYCKRDLYMSMMDALKMYQMEKPIELLCLQEVFLLLLQV